MIEEEACENCHFYWNDECHRYAPRPVQALQELPVQWPMVDSDDWCGEWRMKI